MPEDPYKLIAITPAEQKEKNICFQKEVISQYAGEVHSFFSNDCYQEIVPEGISKGFAEYGNYVTEHDNNHDGVAEIIHKFILKDA